MANLQNLKPFKVGNPGGPGRPKMTEEQRTAKRMAKEMAERAMRRLEHWMDSDNAKASVAACNSIINRAEGMPKQEIEQTGTGAIVPVVNVTIGGVDAQSGPAPKAGKGSS